MLFSNIINFCCKLGIAMWFGKVSLHKCFIDISKIEYFKGLLSCNVFVASLGLQSIFNTYFILWNMHPDSIV